LRGENRLAQRVRRGVLFCGGNGLLLSERAKRAQRKAAFCAAKTGSLSGCERGRSSAAEAGC
jgi:hypothetical protein